MAMSLFHLPAAVDNGFAAAVPVSTQVAFAQGAQLGRVYMHSPYSFHAIEVAAPPPTKFRAPRSPPNSEEWHAKSETPSVSSDEKQSQTHMRVSSGQLQDRFGKFREMAFTSYGSSFLQAAIRDDPEAAQALVWPELFPHFAAMLRDAHACYVVSALLAGHPAAAAVVGALCQDEFLMCSLCTGSLHSRRMIQAFLDIVGAGPFFAILVRSANSICCTQQGCISAQRILDKCVPAEREHFFAIVRANVAGYSCDPFGNYVVQYMLQHGDRAANSEAFVAQMAGRIHLLACDKYASNVIEKALPNMTCAAQSVLVREMASWSDADLLRVLADNVGNYTVQAFIDSVPRRDIDVLAQRLLPLASQVPYGKKLETKVMRRMKGKVEAPQAPTPFF